MSQVAPTPDPFAALDLAHHGVIVSDAADRVVYANALLRSWLGADATALAGAPLQELFAPEERAALVQQAAARQLGVSGERTTRLQFATVDGAVTVPVRLSSTPRFDAEGRYQGTTSVLRDLRGAGEAELAIAAGRAGRVALQRYLTPGVAHAMNTALQAVVGYAGLLARDESLPERTKEPMGHLHAAAIACARLIENLEALADQRAGEPVTLSLAQMLDEALASREVYLPANNVQVVRLVADEAAVWVRADRGRLRRALAHLVGNACELALVQGGGTLELTIDAEGDVAGATLAVCGAAWSPELLGYHATTLRADADPMVLGHAAACGLVAELAGQVLAENTERGAELHFTLPSAAPPAAAPAGSDATPSVLALDARVLVVDDEDFILDLNERVLSGMMHVTTATSADEALRLLQAESFDLIVSDIRMPGALDGMGLYDWAEAARPDQAARMVFTTADTASPQAIDFLVRSRRPFITKPYDVSEYRAFMLRELSRWEGEAE